MLQTWYISKKILHAHSRRKFFAKKIKNGNHWRSAWTLDGKICIKKFTGGTAKNNTCER